METAPAGEVVEVSLIVAGDGRAITLSPGGQILRGEFGSDKEFVCLVEQANGPLEPVSPTDFYRRASQAAAVNNTSPRQP